MALRSLVRPVGRLGIAAGAVLAWGVVAGLVRLPSNDGVQDPSLRERSYGPVYPAGPPQGGSARILRVMLSGDQRTLTVVFIGGAAYTDPADFCATDYEPWLAEREREIDVEIVEFHHQEQATAPPNTACALGGYDWIFHLALAKSFTGSIVNDIGRGETFTVGPSPVQPSLDLRQSQPPRGPVPEPT